MNHMSSYLQLSSVTAKGEYIGRPAAAALSDYIVL